MAGFVTARGDSFPVRVLEVKVGGIVSHLVDVLASLSSSLVRRIVLIHT